MSEPMSFLQRLATMEVCPSSGKPLNAMEQASIQRYERFGKKVIGAFCKEINKRAMARMEITGVLEGAHYAAMRSIVYDLGMQESPDGGYE